MSLLDKKLQAADLMLDLEKELREHALWQDELPTTAQMLSTEPFACDVMPLQQWLQWVFLPRMKAIVESDADLPHACNISAYAEESIGKLGMETGRTLELIKKIDDLFSEG